MSQCLLLLLGMLGPSKVPQPLQVTAAASTAAAASCLGVVTRMTLQLYDVSQAYTGVLVWQDDPEHQNFRWGI